MTTRKQDRRTTESPGTRTALATSNPTETASSAQTPAERAIARFEADRTVRATPWVLPNVDPAAAASEPHAPNSGTSQSNTINQ